MLLVAACVAPRLRSIQILPVAGLVTSTIADGPLQKTEPTGYCPLGPAFTVRLSIQVCPPMLNAKPAVPLLAGAPLMVYVSEPLPLAKVPAAKVAVKPVTPVEATVCPL